MTVIHRPAVVAILLLLAVFASSVQADSLSEMTIVVPAESILSVIKPLLPYQIDLGKNFLGKFWVQSIDNISINKGMVYFSSLITGKDIKYATKIGKQTINFVVGDVKLPSNWEVSFKFDKIKKKLLITPHMQNSKDEREFSQGDALLSTLLTALSGIAYPVDLKNIKPVKSEFHDQLWVLTMNITDVYSAKDKLFVQVKPAVQITSQY
jgi:hypothetical protein